MQTFTGPTLYFIDGSGGADDDTIAFACGPTNEPGAMRSVLLFRLGGEWERAEVDFDSVVSLAFLGPRCFALGEDGHVLAFGRPGANRITVPDLRSPTVERLPAFAELIRLRSPGGQLLAAGMDGQLYRFDGTRWSEWPISVPEVARFDIQDAAASSLDNVHLVGMLGWMVSWDGQWHKITSPTNQNLAAACLGDDGLVYAAGAGGLLLQGSGHRWRIVTHLRTQENIWSLVSYRRRIYASTSRALYILDGDAWQKLNLPDSIQPPFHRLFTTPSKLWSVGELAVACFDGTTWSSVDIPIW